MAVVRDRSRFFRLLISLRSRRSVAENHGFDLIRHFAFVAHFRRVFRPIYFPNLHDFGRFSGIFTNLLTNEQFLASFFGLIKLQGDFDRNEEF